MLEEDIDDTHLCIKCSTTIVGLENYVQHRKNHCSVKRNSSRIVHQVQLEHDDHDHHHHHHGSHYESFDFSEAQSQNFSKDHNEENDKANKSMSESYDLPYDLGADIFFQSLELQSSSKRSHLNHSAPTPTTTISSTITRTSTNLNTSLTTGSKVSSPSSKVSNRKSGSIQVLNHSDEWINPTTSNNSDNLMKAVHDISGTKKCDSIFKLIPFQHDSPDQSDDGHGEDDDELEEEDDEESEDDEDYLTVPANHTGGKWKPENSLRNSPGWDNDHHWSEYKSNNKEIDDIENDLINPPPGHTKGKWVPGTKVLKLNYKEDMEIEKIFTHQYWCNTCNRKLASKLLYERHLKSNLHLKRAKPEQELEKAAVQTMSERLKKPSIYLNSSIYTTELESPAVLQEYSGKESPVKFNKRKRRKHFIKCETCNTRLPKFLLGKHLISHYHYRRMNIDPKVSFDMILENIHRIVHQSPFQCQPCRFYCNTEDDFILHWNSNAHLDLTEGPGKCWCTFCKFECEDNNQMRRHLLGSDHKEVILAINRSVPIIIRKKIVIECTKCKQHFRYNMELRKHAELCSKEPLGTASNDYQSKFKCEKCGEIVKSQLALQKHEKYKHSSKFYFCSICKVRLKTSSESMKHRRTSKHKIMAKKMKNKENMTRKCRSCSEIFSDLNYLKRHIIQSHPDEMFSCSYCGEKFAISQELGRHMRDKICQRKHYDLELEEKLENESQDHLKIVKTSENLLPNGSNEEIQLEVSHKNEKNYSKTTEILNITAKDYNTENDHSKILKNQPIQIENEEKQESIIVNICAFCNFKTTSPAEFIFHELLHNLPSDLNSKTKINCPKCSKSLVKHSLRLHLRLHTNERIFECPHCKLGFIRKYNLKEHINNIHLKVQKIETNSTKDTTNSNKEFVCEICFKTFSKLSTYNRHLNTHKEPDKRLQCTFPNCIFVAKTLYNLNVHKTTHTNQKIYACDFDGCTYKGTNLQNLKKHQRSHLNLEKKYSCDFIGCSFKTKHSPHLKRHIIIHSGEKTQKCPHCNFTCNNETNLRKHILETKKHRGLFLFECKLCQQTGVEKPFKTNFKKDYRTHLVLIHKTDKDLNAYFKYQNSQVDSTVEGGENYICLDNEKNS